MLNLKNKTNQFQRPLPINEQWTNAIMEYGYFVQCSIISFALIHGTLPKNGHLLSVKHFKTFQKNQFESPIYLDQYFEAIKGLEDKGIVDVLSVSNYLKDKYNRTDAFILAELTNKYFLPTNIEYHLFVLIDHNLHFELLSTIRNIHSHISTIYNGGIEYIEGSDQYLPLNLQIEALENLFVSLQANLDISECLDEILNYFIENKFMPIAIELIQNLIQDFKNEMSAAIQKSKEECIENNAINMVENLYKHHNHDYSKNECYKILSDIFVLIIPLRKIDGNINSQLNLIRNTLYK